MSKPNILFMHSHNTVQPYGHAVPTPSLQKLAEEGVLFRRAFAAAPTCSPSRAAFLTGMYPHTCGMLGLAHRGFAMPDYAPHLANFLKPHGYQTILAGVEHTAPDTETIGYDRILSTDDTNYPNQPDLPGAAEAVVRFLDAAPDAPFFINLGLNETHRSFPKAEPENHPAEDPRYSLPPSPLPTLPRPEPTPPTSKPPPASWTTATAPCSLPWSATVWPQIPSSAASPTTVCSSRATCAI